MMTGWEIDDAEINVSENDCINDADIGIRMIAGRGSPVDDCRTRYYSP